MLKLFTSSSKSGIIFVLYACSFWQNLQCEPEQSYEKASSHILGGLLITYKNKK